MRVKPRKRGGTGPLGVRKSFVSTGEGPSEGLDLLHPKLYVLLALSSRWDLLELSFFPKGSFTRSVCFHNDSLWVGEFGSKVFFSFPIGLKLKLRGGFRAAARNLEPGSTRFHIKIPHLRGSRFHKGSRQRFRIKP